MPYFYFDPTYILVLIGVVLSLIASAQVKSAYKKYEKVSTRSGFTAEQVAAMILRNAGITDVTIRPIAGELTDNYNPKDHTLNLSQNVYGSRSIAAIGVAAHECGHAIQHAEGICAAWFSFSDRAGCKHWFYIIMAIDPDRFTDPKTGCMYHTGNSVIFTGRCIPVCNPAG